jgi:hypothetical protein
MQFFIGTVTTGGLATFTMSGQAYEYNSIFDMQVSGVNKANPVDIVAGNSTITADKTIGTVTTNQANEMLIMSFHSDGALSYAPVPTTLTKLAGTSGIERPVYYGLLPDVVSNLRVGATANNNRIWDGVLITLRGII